ncbi:putative uncharacterized protein ZNRD1-AS1 isoform X1 [Gorilla gorilla gorilla]|uniref:putative uncharacterized protein ZNRD1-AS1 isoform X1 n=1 Tax=Gorilla gorilla gorilla TaxID=9595 RepID=UPI0024458C83|nr:putative uncharacterized protein ZNRD1-AS1 isoform X1 [Gorilla gorilla gorilla]XP_055245848.1 putative uncharacterized protein ZNRD1-AS1 isoform X1 [Gorilla gorilla gorilla]XP_055245850.1 putative uncharacterized protein ZNRD1-AS1 isoform X1 [Gorilla gorilla gorilla]XP_055245851.1 putative uncharacterized protein ZNRD1-AS1 isoform X1 [Gorilla gorilla gorilla]XP_055245852.1 putative uncharacterized protein ZNRD1-AS1 isoform X1 [Gorilla gorilla gorilla]XP_055245853.1 putative uncharacterized 
MGIAGPDAAEWVWRGRSCVHQAESCCRFPFALSGLAWGTSSKDRRIASGQQSPLEKKILNLGGAHTTAARQLIIQKYQEECEILCREQAVSLDYWLAKAESYYNKIIVEMMKEETGNEIKKKMEEKTTQSVEGLKQYCLVPERQMKHIERHIHQTGKAGEFKNKSFRQVLQPPNETKLPKIMPEGHGIQNAQRRKQVNEREQMQTKDHQERMIRGRELTEQRLKERILRRNQSQLLTYEKHERVKEIKEFERVIAYPLFQPCGRSWIKALICWRNCYQKNRSRSRPQKSILGSCTGRN